MDADGDTVAADQQAVDRTRKMLVRADTFSQVAPRQIDLAL